MLLEQVLFAVVILCAGGLFLRNVFRLVRTLKIGKADDRFGNTGRRIGNVLRVAFGQSKLLREPFAGLLHFFIFWGFVVLLSAVLESMGQGFAPRFSLALLGPFYGPLTYLQELFGLLVVVAVVVSLFRRIVMPPKRLRVSGHGRWDAILILSMILGVMITMFGQNGMRVSLGIEHTGACRPISTIIAGLPFSSSPGTQEVWLHVFFWGHMLLVLGFLNYLPYSKHLHILTSIPNVYFSSLEPQGALRPINLADETLTKFGATDVPDLTWKQILDGYTCTECGRCTSVCPANTTGKLLNPKKIMTDLRARTTEKAGVMLTQEAQQETGEPSPEHQLLDNFITEQELWACTTCGACMQECPVMIEHVGTIVDLRRGLVLNESRFPDELKTTFSNLERNFTPWGFGHATRADWSAGLNIPLLADVQHADILFWVGCAGAYDARYRKVTQAFAQLMKLAGVNFAILGTEEKCNGDPARRMGNEYLAQTMITENIATLNRYHVSKIVVTCPHCLQSLGKEYRQFGGTYEVIHHSTFLKDLVEQGKLKLSAGKKAAITFHDPCYLGRYNREYDAPRQLLDALPGTTSLEMPRSRDRSFCCGAGGGRMWMEEREGKRVNIERSQEALSVHPDTIATGCPFCMTMISDGVKATEHPGEVDVKDIAELVLEAVES